MDRENWTPERLNMLEQKIKDIHKQLADIVTEHGSALYLPDKYYNLQKQKEALIGERHKEICEMLKSRKPPKEEEKKIFVNGFGEATRREITSAAYKRAQARIDKEIESRMRGR